MKYYRIYFQASRLQDDSEQYQLRYGKQKVNGHNLREGIDKLKLLLDDLEAIEIKRDELK
jgi:hypothetical protein